MASGSTHSRIDVDHQHQVDLVVGKVGVGRRATDRPDVLHAGGRCRPRASGASRAGRRSPARSRRARPGALSLRLVYPTPAPTSATVDPALIFKASSIASGCSSCSRGVAHEPIGPVKRHHVGDHPALVDARPGGGSIDGAVVPPSSL